MPRDDSRSVDDCRCADQGRCLRRHLCRIGRVSGASIRIVRFARGERQACAGAGRARVFIVKSGMVAAAALMSDGRRQLISFQVPGDIVCPFGVGEAECWSEALTATAAWEVTLAAARVHGRPDAELAAALFDIAHESLARALAHVVLLGRLDGTERVSAFLADLGRRTGTQARAGAAWRLSLPLSREDMADYLGLNAETVSRILSRLKRAGLVRFQSPTECEIPDLDRLSNQAPIAAPMPRSLGAIRPVEEIRP